jgi:hypothetical protein
MNPVVGAAALAASREAGGLTTWPLLSQTALLDPHAGRIPDAAGHLRESLRLAVQAGTNPGERELVTRSPRRHLRRDRRPAVHQRSHGQFAPGPIRDKTGCRRRADLTRLA